MNKRHFFIFLALFCSLALRGQRLSIDSCLALARLNNCTIQTARLDIEEARQVRNQARTKYFPQISASAMGYHAMSPLMKIDASDISNASARDILNTLYADYGVALGLPNGISMFSQGVTATVNAVQPVYMGGKIVAGNNLAKVGVRASELKEQVTERDVLLAVEESYWLVVNLEAKRQTIDAVQSLLDTIHAIVGIAVQSGIAMPNDLLQVQLREDELAAQRLRLTNGITLARQALCQSIGIGYSDSIVLDTLSCVDEMMVQKANASVESRPESSLLELQVRAEQLKRRMLLADALPSVVVGGMYGYINMVSPFEPSGRHQFVDTDQKRYLNGIVGVTVSVPVTGWWETAHKLKQSDILIKKAELQQTDMTEKMRLQTTQAYDHAIESAALVRQFAASEKTARENLRVSKLGYSAGLQTITDLLQAQALYLQAENNLIDSRINYRVAKRRYGALTPQRNCGER